MPLERFGNKSQIENTWRKVLVFECLTAALAVQRHPGQMELPCFTHFCLGLETRQLCAGKSNQLNTVVFGYSAETQSNTTVVGPDMWSFKYSSPSKWQGLEKLKIACSTTVISGSQKTWIRFALNSYCMMTSSNGNRVTGPLCGEFTCHRWIPLTKASNAELWCFLWSAPE